MALRGIQEYIARDANNIARVEDDNISRMGRGTSYAIFELTYTYES